RVVVVGRHLAHDLVDPEGVGLVEVVEGLYLTGLRGEQPRGEAGVLDGLPRLDQLGSLDPLGGHEEGDGLVGDCLLCGHVLEPTTPPVATTPPEGSSVPFSAGSPPDTPPEAMMDR